MFTGGDNTAAAPATHESPDLGQASHNNVPAEDAAQPGDTWVQVAGAAQSFPDTHVTLQPAVAGDAVGVIGFMMPDAPRSAVDFPEEREGRSTMPIQPLPSRLVDTGNVPVGCVRSRPFRFWLHDWGHRAILARPDDGAWSFSTVRSLVDTALGNLAYREGVGAVYVGYNRDHFPVSGTTCVDARGCSNDGAFQRARSTITNMALVDHHVELHTAAGVPKYALCCKVERPHDLHEPAANDGQDIMWARYMQHISTGTAAKRETLRIPVDDSEFYVRHVLLSGCPEAFGVLAGHAMFAMPELLEPPVFATVAIVQELVELPRDLQDALSAENAAAYEALMTTDNGLGDTHPLCSPMLILYHDPEDPNAAVPNPRSIRERCYYRSPTAIHTGIDLWTVAFADAYGLDGRSGSERVINVRVMFDGAEHMGVVAAASHWADAKYDDHHELRKAIMDVFLPVVAELASHHDRHVISAAVSMLYTCAVVLRQWVRCDGNVRLTPEIMMSMGVMANAVAHVGFGVVDNQTASLTPPRFWTVSSDFSRVERFDDRAAAELALVQAASFFIEQAQAGRMGAMLNDGGAVSPLSAQVFVLARELGPSVLECVRTAHALLLHNWNLPAELANAEVVVMDPSSVTMEGLCGAYVCCSRNKVDSLLEVHVSEYRATQVMCDRSKPSRNTYYMEREDKLRAERAAVGAFASAGRYTGASTTAEIALVDGACVQYRNQARAGQPIDVPLHWSRNHGRAPEPRAYHQQVLLAGKWRAPPEIVNTQCWALDAEELTDVRLYGIYGMDTNYLSLTKVIGVRAGGRVYHLCSTWRDCIQQDTKVLRKLQAPRVRYAWRGLTTAYEGVQGEVLTAAQREAVAIGVFAGIEHRPQ